jgi:hypothetical protein
MCLWCLVFKRDFAVKWHKLSNDQTIDASQLQEVFEAASAHFKADGSTPHGNFLNMP